MCAMPASALSNYFEYEDISEEVKGHEINIADKNTAVKMMAKLDHLQNRIDDLEEYKREKVRLLDEKIDKLEEQSETIREGLEAFIVEHNDGETLSYPDVGTAYVSEKTKIKIEDEDEVLNYLEENLPEEEKEDYIRVKKSVKKRNFKKYADEELKITGRLLPGAEQKEKRTFVYRSPR